MKPIQTIFLSLLFSLLFFGCDDKLSSEETVYSGTFTVTYTNEDGTQRTRSGPVKLELRQDGKYFCSGNSDCIPAGGSGTYSLKGGEIIFNDENFWTADFDWNLILNGEYTFTMEGKRLHLSANKNNVGHYAYDLVRE